MKQLLVTTLLLLTTYLFSAGAIDNYGRLVRSARQVATRGAVDRAAAYYPAIIQLDSEDVAVDRMTADGVRVLRRRDEFVLAFVPYGCLDKIDKYPGVRYVSISRPSIVNLDRAIPMAGVDKIHDGAGALLHGFDGTGVVVGFCDIGFDPSHPAFRASDGSLRVRRVVQYSESTGERLQLDDEDAILAWRTDDTDNNHATHVAGILAGSDNSLGYGGVAPGADIVATLGQLTDVGLLAGAEDVIEYARSVGRPAVINMSVGNYIGPHDGSTLFNQYLARLGREAVICLSAGNEGSSANVVDVTFSSGQPTTFSQIVGTDWVFFNLNGNVDIWSDSSRPVEVAIGICDDPERKIIYQTPFMTLTADGGLWGISSDVLDVEGVVRDEEFARYFDGAVYASAEVNPFNGRYNVMFNVETSTDIVSSEGAWARYRPAMIVRGSEGQQALCFADGIRTSFVNLWGGVRSTTDWSVSDLACGDNIICVGMYNSRTEAPRLDGSTAQFNLTVGAPNPGSGYATLLDGRVLPDVCAPGAMVVSAMSTPYIEAHPDEVSSMAAAEDRDGSTYYWYANGGTSMSSPFLAGVIATWLQANPTLSVGDVKEIIAQTHVKAPVGPDNPRNGRGWVDPYAGLLKVIERNSGIIDVNNSPVADFSLQDGELIVVCSAGGRVVLYDFAGATVGEMTVSPGENRLRLDGLAGGFYVASLHGRSYSFALCGR